MDTEEKSIAMVVLIIAIVMLIAGNMATRKSQPDVYDSMTPYERQQISNMQRAD